MPAGGGSYERYRGGSDPRVRVANRDAGGAWRAGHLRFTVFSSSQNEIWIKSLDRVDESVDARPVAWVYRTHRTECGASPPGAGVQLMLDARGLRALGARAGTRAPFPIRVDPGDAVTIDIAVASCQLNRQWRLALTYAEAGRRAGTIRVGGTYRTFAVADQHTVDVRGDMVNQRLTLRTSRAAQGACTEHDLGP
jgi:hypothetical protein